MEPVSLKKWRSAQTPPATATAVAKALGGISHSLVLEWEKGTRSPGVELALRLERHTDGAVPIETWGYTHDLVDLMRTAVERRDATELLHDASTAGVRGAA
jgi:hypothetical protein